MRKIVKTVRKSVVAKEAFVVIQKRENLPAHKFIIDQPTRWCSTFFMAQRFLEQKKAVQLLCFEIDKLSSDCLTRNDWELLENVLDNE